MEFSLLVGCGQNWRALIPIRSGDRKELREGRPAQRLGRYAAVTVHNYRAMLAQLERLDPRFSRCMDMELVRAGFVALGTCSAA